MTTLAEVIRAAYREGDLIPIARDPTAQEQAEALPRLQSLLASVLGNEAGEKLESLPIGNNNVSAPLGYPAWQPLISWWAPLNVRLVCNLTGSTPINMNPMPQDGSRLAVQDMSGNFATYPLTLVGNGRTINGQDSVTLDADGFVGEWFFRADLGDWRPVTPLTVDDDIPYPIEFDDMFITLLNLRLSPRNGQPMSNETGMALERSRTQFRARYQQIVTTPADPATLRLSRQTFPNGRRWGPGGYGPRWSFYSGWPW